MAHWFVYLPSQLSEELHFLSFGFSKQSETMIPWILEAGVAARRVVLLSSPLIPGELTEVRGGRRERDKKNNFSLDQLPRWVHCMATKTLVPAQGRNGTQGMKQVVRRGKDENVSFADTTGINCLWNCGQSTSLVAKHRNGSRSPWPPSCWSRFFDYSNQMSLSCNSPAQNKDFFFLPLPHVSSIVTENVECVEIE